MSAISTGDVSSEHKKKDDRKLAIVFACLVVIGLGNKVFSKLMTIPMYNYANFLNLLTTFIFLPVCFAYIIPMSRSGKFSPGSLEYEYVLTLSYYQDTFQKNK